MMRPIIETPSSAASLFFAALPAAAREERVFVLPLDGNGKVLAEPILVSVGHEDGTAQIDVGTIFREALKAGAEEIIVAHNHPSGNLTPSKADTAATAKLREAAALLGVPLIDHLIIGKAGARPGGTPPRTLKPAPFRSSSPSFCPPSNSFHLILTFPRRAVRQS